MSVAVSFECASRSDVGKRRSSNEDAVLIDEDIGLLVVCDGVGGHTAGEVASREAADALQRYIAANIGRHPRPAERASELLERAFQAANEHVVELAAKREEWRDMGATCVALLVSDDGIALAHAGDSRCYRLESGAAVRLTSDHTTDEIARRFYDEQEPEASAPRKSSGILVQAMGRDPANFRATVAVEPVAAGATFLLCSDGLTDELTDGEIAGITSRGGTPDDVCDALVHAANEAGGRDNVTVALLRVTAVNSHRAGWGARTRLALELGLWAVVLFSLGFVLGALGWSLWRSWI
jgi:PPM family protein phosphatase